MKQQGKHTVIEKNRMQLYREEEDLAGFMKMYQESIQTAVEGTINVGNLVHTFCGFAFVIISI